MMKTDSPNICCIPLLHHPHRESFSPPSPKVAVLDIYGVFAAVKSALNKLLSTGQSPVRKVPAAYPLAFTPKRRLCKQLKTPNFSAVKQLRYLGTILLVALHLVPAMRVSVCPPGDDGHHHNCSPAMKRAQRQAEKRAERSKLPHLQSGTDCFSTKVGYDTDYAPRAFSLAKKLVAVPPAQAIDAPLSPQQQEHLPGLEARPPPRVYLHIAPPRGPPRA